MIGTTLLHYRIVDRLGRGGMGEVFLARDTKLDRDVAIKVSEGLNADPARLARFEREAKSLAGLNHPNIATLHGFEDDDGARFLVMELVEGHTLAELIREDGPLDPHKALEITAQVVNVQLGWLDEVEARLAER